MSWKKPTCSSWILILALKMIILKFNFFPLLSLSHFIWQLNTGNVPWGWNSMNEQVSRNLYLERGQVPSRSKCKQAVQSNWKQSWSTLHQNCVANWKRYWRRACKMWETTSMTSMLNKLSWSWLSRLFFMGCVQLTQKDSGLESVGVCTVDSEGVWTKVCLSVGVWRVDLEWVWTWVFGVVQIN